MNGEAVAPIGRVLVDHMGTNHLLEMRKRFKAKHDNVHNIRIQAKLQI